MGLSYEGTVTPAHPAFRRVENALAAAMIDGGYHVYDKAQAGLNIDCSTFDCKRLDDVQITELAESIDADVDLLITYVVFKVEEQGIAVDRFKVRFEGRIVDLKRELLIGVWEQDPQAFISPRAGLGPLARKEQEANDIAKQAADAAAVIVEKLAMYERRHDYSLSLSNITSKEMLELTKLLVQREDYRQGDLKKIRQGEPRRQLLHNVTDSEWRFTTSLSRGALEAVLRQYATQVGIGEVLISGDLSADSFIVQRARMPFLWGYFFGAISVVVIVLVALLILLYRHHENRMLTYAEAKYIDQGLEYLEGIRLFALTRISKWQNRRNDWLEQRKVADQAMDEAEKALEKLQFDEVKSAVGKALESNAENQRALRFIDQLPAWETAAAQVAEVGQCLDAEPETALQLLNEADGVLPRLERSISQLRQQAERRLQESLLDQCKRRAQQGFDTQRPYWVLSAVHTAQHSLRGLTGFEQECDSFQAMRDQALEDITGIGDSCIGDQALAGLTVLLKSEVEIGRVSGRTPADIAIGYKRISRAGKQTCLRFRQGQFYIEDQNSANGTWLSSRLLGAGEVVAISDQPCSISLGGNRAENRAGLCQLSVKWGDDDRDVLILNFSKTVINLLDATSVTDAWSSLEEDISRRWLMLQGRVAVGIYGDILDVGCLLGSEPVAWLINQPFKGISAALWVAPADTTTHRLTVDDSPVLEAVPLTEGVLVGLDNLRFRFIGITAAQMT